MLVTIASFSFPHEAHLAKAQLDAAGIPGFIADEHTINMQWLYSDAMGGVRLQVPAEFAEEAKALLSEPVEILENPETAEMSPQQDTPANCPACGALLGERRSDRRAAMISWLLLGLPLFLGRDIRRCPSCGKTVDA